MLAPLITNGGSLRSLLSSYFSCVITISRTLPSSLVFRFHLHNSLEIIQTLLLQPAYSVCCLHLLHIYLQIASLEDQRARLASEHLPYAIAFQQAVHDLTLSTIEYHAAEDRRVMTEAVLEAMGKVSGLTAGSDV